MSASMCPAAARTGPAILLAVGLLIGLWAAPVPAFGRDCTTEKDTGRKMQCRAENLNEAVDGLVTTVVDDQGGHFSTSQKTQLKNVKARAQNETGRLESEDFKSIAKKRKEECPVQEILGDPASPAADLNNNGECDGTEICLGNEDGICNGKEMALGGCAEVLNDGIGDDDGICENQGKFHEACVQLCETDAIMTEGSETNVDADRAAEMDRALTSATALVEDADTKVKDFLAVRSGEVVMAAACDPAAMPPCVYLKCLLTENRTSTSDTIEDLAFSAVVLQGIADAFRDLSDTTIPIPFTGGSIDARGAAIPLGLAANAVHTIASLVEVIDDSETAARVDATARCAMDNSDQLTVIDELATTANLLLRTPLGQRDGFPIKKPKPRPGDVRSQ
ncbi:MAG: hypothetical protein ACOX4Z_08515 [Desulfobulbus sp.]|jgi:hypothetical protein